MTPSTASSESPAAQITARREQIETEIEFWRELIETCPLTQSSECIERMHQALDFAVTRLAELSQAPPKPVVSLVHTNTQRVIKRSGTDKPGIDPGNKL